MKCHNCGAELTDGAAFCCFCGCAQAVAEVPAAPFVAEAPVVTEAPVVMEVPVVMEAPIVNEVPVQAYEEPAPTPVEKKPKRPVGLIIAACIAAVLSVVVILGLCTNWFGFYGPATRIAMAAKNTIEKGNFTVVMSTKTEMNIFGSPTTSENEMTIEVDLDLKKRELMLFGETEEDQGDVVVTRYLGIIDDYFVSGIKYDGYENYTKEDISDELEEFFDTYEDTKDMDWEELFEMIEDTTGFDVEDIIDIKAFKKCVTAYFRKLNNNKWLEENAGYSTSKENGVRYYEFEPNLYKFSKASLEFFKEAFEDKDDYDDIMEGLKSARKEISDFDIEISIGVQRSKLAEVELKVDADALCMEYSIEFQNIGKTEIDVDFLEEMLDKAN